MKDMDLISSRRNACERRSGAGLVEVYDDLPGQLSAVSDQLSGEELLFSWAGPS
jgi:hypothetical protein